MGQWNIEHRWAKCGSQGGHLDWMGPGGIEERSLGCRVAPAVKMCSLSQKCQRGLFVFFCKNHQKVLFCFNYC